MSNLSVCCVDRDNIRSFLRRLGGVPVLCVLMVCAAGRRLGMRSKLDLLNIPRVLLSKISSLSELFLRMSH